MDPRPMAWEGKQVTRSMAATAEEGFPSVASVSGLMKKKKEKSKPKPNPSRHHLQKS